MMEEALNGEHSQHKVFCPNDLFPGHFTMVHERFADDDQLMETEKTVLQWKQQLLTNLKVFLI